MAQNFRMTGRLPNESMIAMDEITISRGFRSKRQEQTPKNRLPPGQYVTTDFPVLSAGPTPQIKLGDWTFALQLGGSLLGKWNWAEFEALPQTTIRTDIHCVTKWSKLDTTWQGVTLAGTLVRPACRYSPHGRRRLPGAAQLFDRLASRRRIAHFDCGARA